MKRQPFRAHNPSEGVAMNNFLHKLLSRLEFKYIQIKMCRRKYPLLKE